LSPSPKPKEIAALAGARALPPLMIVLFHFSEGHHYSGVPAIDLAATRGYLWVEFFFVLSGFILTHVYGPRLSELLTRRGYVAFLRARLIRLYPLHLFMLLALAGLMVTARLLAAAGGYRSIYDMAYHPDMSAKGFVASLFLVHAWNSLNTLTWNGASWFVSVEFALILLFPFFVWLTWGRVWRGAALAATGLAGLIALDLTSRHGLDITYHNGVLRGLADFSAGVGLAVLFRGAGKIARLPPAAHSLAQLAVLLWLGWAIYDTGWSHTHKDILTVLPLMAMVFVLAFDKGFLADAFKTRLLQRMGVWSYAIYMGQTFWLQAVRIVEQRLYPSPDSLVLGTKFSTLIWWLEPVGLILVCVAWGALLAVGIEHPAAAWLRRQFDRKLDRAVAAAPS
jgi:peptidoglycan/LPS O-acetylase OafA/YrhL